MSRRRSRRQTTRQGSPGTRRSLGPPTPNDVTKLRLLVHRPPGGRAGLRGFEVARGVDVGHDRRVDLDLDDVELRIGTVERQGPVREALLQERESRLRPGAGKWPGLWHRRVAAGIAEQTEQLGCDPRAIDRQEHRDIVRCSPQTRDDACDGRAYLRAVVQDVERQLPRLADDENLIASGGEHARPRSCRVSPSRSINAFGEPSAGSLPDQEDTGQRSTRHDSV